MGQCSQSHRGYQELSGGRRGLDSWSGTLRALPGSADLIQVRDCIAFRLSVGWLTGVACSTKLRRILRLHLSFPEEDRDRLVMSALAQDRRVRVHLLPLLQTLPFRSRVELKQTHTDLPNSLLALPHSVHRALPWGHFHMHPGSRGGAGAHARLERMASSQICIWLFPGTPKYLCLCPQLTQASHKSGFAPSASDPHLPNLRDSGTIQRVRQ